MSVVVVSGTGTGVGKTVVTAAVAALARARGASVAVVKAAQTGVPPDEADVEAVRRLAGLAADEVVECARFEPALSPAAAARVSGRPPVALSDVAGVVRARAALVDLVLVEGAGGLLVRFDDDGATVADLARELAAPVLVVAAAGLGTLNHTALTLEALAHRGLDLAGVVIGAWPAQPGLAETSNLRDLATLAARPLAGAVAEGAGRLDPAEFLVAARAGLAPALGGTWTG
jgi:dethiobiotin synthetase